MKKFFSLIAMVAFLCSCEQIKGLMEQKSDTGSSSSSSSSAAKFDPMTLKSYVLPNIKHEVDVTKAADGSSATRDMGNNMSSTVTVIGKKDGKTLVELTASYIKDHANNKPAVIAVLVDGSGKVHKAWGGLAGADGVELPVPAEQKVNASGQKVETETKDIDDITLFGFKGDGKQHTTNNVTSKVWMNADFPFFSGVLKSEAGPSKVVVSDYKKSGAKSQLKIK